MKFSKLINVNLTLNNIIGGSIAEYDIRSAGASAMRLLRGEKVYSRLMKLVKKERNIAIGKMMLSDKTLSREVNDMLLLFMNKFLSANRITEKQVVYTTRDSIVLYNKIPRHLKFDGFEFVNKDGEFSTMLTVDRFRILFDSMTGLTLIKGIKDDIVENSSFVNKYLKQLLLVAESTRGSGDIYRSLGDMRNKYMNSTDTKIYKDLSGGDKYGIYSNGGIVYLDVDELPDNAPIAKSINYDTFVMPIMRILMSVK